MSVDRLLTALEGVVRTGPNNWRARCGAHKGRSRALAVRELDDGRVLCHCFAGCDLGDVLKAAGLALEDLYPPRPATGLAAHARPREQRPYSARDLLDAFKAELHLVWVVLADVAAGRELTAADRARAGKARARCVALLEELRDAR